MDTVVASRRSASHGRARAEDLDRFVGARMRERRMMLGLTQQHMAELIGVTYQQAHKYEKGINRIAAGRLFQIAGALGVEIGYFFEGAESRGSFRPTSQQRLLLELARSFVTLPNRRHQEAICGLARALATEEPSVGDAANSRNREICAQVDGPVWLRNDRSSG